LTKISLKLSTRDRKYLKKLSSRKETREDLEEAVTLAFNRSGLIIAGRIVKNYLSGQRLNRQTGSLARSIAHDVQEYRGLPSLRIGIFRGPALKYAAVQEYGTKSKNSKSPIKDITPKNGKALAWPINAPGKTPKDFDDSKFIPYRRGTIAIGALYDAKKLKKLRQADPENFSLREIQPLFVLLRKLAIEPKYYLRDGVKENVPVIAKELAQAIKKGILQR